MGRWSYSNKQEADDLKKFSTSFLKKHGYFSVCRNSGIMTWSRNGEKTGSMSIESEISEKQNYIRLIYTQTNLDSKKKKDFDCKIPLTTTPCYFGGKRYWFICSLYKNGQYCGRRVGTLYKGGDYFGCRHCYNLTYESKKLSGYQKSFGSVISIPELEELEVNIKRKFYNGKMTRKYKRFIEKERKSEFQMEGIVAALNRRL